MTREETIKVLAILKAAYPNSYRGMTKEEANGTVAVWAAQFANIPVNVVMIAVNKLISTNNFTPTINEVKQRISGLYWEVWEQLEEHRRATEGVKLYKDSEPIKMGTPLDENTVAQLKQILAVVEPMRQKTKIEPSICELIGSYSGYLADGQKTKALPE